MLCHGDTVEQKTFGVSFEEATQHFLMLNVGIPIGGGGGGANLPKLPPGPALASVCIDMWQSQIQTF